MLIAWSVTEVIRYSFFVVTLSGYSLGIISWLRYNMFFVLYPLGISSECWLVYKAIEPARKVRQEYAWLLQLTLFIYIPGMYGASTLGEKLANILQDRISYLHI
jgi:very-long-chain (3R)-3-hydroxyacyl-CoA dehydratase